ncbi:hypothetical protein GCM10027414_14170 [Humibacter ginsengiterrae]
MIGCREFEVAVAEVDRAAVRDGDRAAAQSEPGRARPAHIAGDRYRTRAGVDDRFTRRRRNGHGAVAVEAVHRHLVGTRGVERDIRTARRHLDRSRAGIRDVLDARRREAEPVADDVERVVEL